MRQANYKQQAMYTIQQSKKVSIKTCVAKIRHTEQKKKKKSPCWLRVDTPAKSTPDYKLQTPETKKHSEEHWYKTMWVRLVKERHPQMKNRNRRQKTPKLSRYSVSWRSFGLKNPPFTLGGVRANVQPKSSIPIGAKVEIKSAPRALH
jgi:hypothetical protein